MSDFREDSLENLLLPPVSGSRPAGGVNYSGEIPSVGGENITMDGGFRFYPVKKVSKEYFDSTPRGHLNDLDVLINKDGANTGKSTIFRNSPYSNASVNEHVFILRGKPDRLDQEYLHYLLQLPSVKNTLSTKITGSAQPGLNSTFIKNFHVLIAPLPEQKKIASILTSVDGVIENTHKQIDKLQDLKKATINELLTKGIGHTEFKDSEIGTIPKSWGVSIVKNCIVEITSGWSPDCLPEPVVGSQWGILKTTSVTWNGFDINENKALPAHLNGRAQISLRAGDVLVTRAGPIDRVGVVAFCNETYPKIMLSDKIIRIRCKSDELTGEFLSIWLGSSVTQKNMRSKISGMAEAQSNISQDILKSIPMPLPSLAEQQKIVEILQSLDVRIIMQKNKLAQTQALKKSLMQDLLTGKVRVQVN